MDILDGVSDFTTEFFLVKFNLIKQKPVTFITKMQQISFTLDMLSITHMAHNCKETASLPYLSNQRCSQDHISLFFLFYF